MGMKSALDVGGVTYGPFTVNDPPGDTESETFTVTEGDLIHSNGLLVVSSVKSHSMSSIITVLKFSTVLLVMP